MFGTWIGRIVKTYDYINRVFITLPLTVYEGIWTTLFPLFAMHHLDGSCVCVGFFLKLLRSPTVFTIRPILAPKVRHLHDLHTFSSVTSHKL